MKIFILTLSLYLSLLGAYSVYAGNNSLLSSYPAPSGSYNKVLLQNLQGAQAPACTQSNKGLLYMDPTTNTLNVCATTNTGGLAYAAIPFPETCFNLFCSYQSPATQCATPSVCPTGYATSGLSDSFLSSTSGATSYYVTSTVCCSSSAVASPSY